MHFALSKYFNTKLVLVLMLHSSNTICYDVYVIKELRNNALSTVACPALMEHNSLQEVVYVILQEEVEVGGLRFCFS